MVTDWLLSGMGAFIGSRRHFRIARRSSEVQSNSSQASFTGESVQEDSCVLYADGASFHEDQGKDHVEDPDGGELVCVVPCKDAPCRVRADRVVVLRELLVPVLVLLLLKLPDLRVWGACDLDQSRVETGPENVRLGPRCCSCNKRRQHTLVDRRSRVTRLSFSRRCS